MKRVDRDDRDDRGSAVVEVALMAPVILGFLMVVIFAGRVVQAQSEVQSASAAAARAASQEATAANATERAEDVATANLTAAEVECSESDILVDTDDFVPGGSVQVTVICIAPLDDLMFLDLPGERQLRATSTEVIDTFRGGP